MVRRPFVLEPSAACLEGHFPGHPVIPGVVLLDAAIDIFGVSTPMRIEQAKFIRPCLPGMALELVMLPRDGGADLRVEHDGQLMASARFGFVSAMGGPHG